MNAIKTLLLFFLSIGVKGSAQDSLMPLYDIREEASSYILRPEQRQLLEDKGGNLGIDDVMNPKVFFQFHTDNSAQTGMGFSGIKDYWMRFRLKNSMGKDHAFIFPVDVKRYDFYVIRSNGKREHHKSGWAVAFREKDSLQTRNALLIRIANHEEIGVYLNVHLFSHEKLKDGISVNFYLYENYIRDEFFNTSKFEGETKHAFVAGLMLFAFVLNVFFFSIVKEKMYLYYALLMLAEACYFWFGSTFLVGRTNLLVRNAPVLEYYIYIVFSYMLGFLFVTLFVRHFLKLPIHYPRWNKLLMVLCIGWLVSMAGGLLADYAIPRNWYYIPGFIERVIFLLFTLTLFISFLLPKKETTPYMKLAVIAALPILFNWGVVLNLVYLVGDFSTANGTTIPTFITWLGRNFPAIEMICISWFAVLFTWILLQKYAQIRKELTLQALEREKERAELIGIQKEELEKQVQVRTGELRQSLDYLKNTQQQLILSEKMASLGELTAGIAHEIQNPLNFVNNFSDVNKELADELEEEANKGNLDEVKIIAKDIKENEEKINHHGKRADAIVKGMLQHSRTSSGQKEPTDINALCDEYLRLAYHGLRAKDKSFNAKFETDFDNSIEKINVVPQDIGRVVLNLINNAFYAVSEKAKQNVPGYEPTVTVKTSKTPPLGGRGAGIVISVKDNGKGIPDSIKEKIFQPFFTTKPTGSGTGLGLSLSYDIIKAHGGEIKLNSKEAHPDDPVGQGGTEFIIQLPV